MRLKISTLALIAICSFVPSLINAQNTKLDIIKVIPVDENGNKIASFKRGKYIRVDWSASYKKSVVNDKVFSASLTVKADYQATIFGKKINYSINFPMSGSGGALKSIINSSNDADILNQNQNYREFTDYLIPVELPPGKLTVTVTSKTNIKNVSPLSFKKTIDLK